MRGSAAILFSASAVFGADLTGIWVGQIERQNNTPLDVAFQFVQKGSTLTGKLYGDYQSTPISEAKVEGDAVSFIVLTSEQAGNEVNEVRLSYVGTLKDGELELNRERISARNAGNRGEGRVQRPNSNNSKPTPPIRLKRLIR
jgi:hypothetical protein